MAFVAWPALDELKQVLDVTSDDWDGEGPSGDEEDTTRLSRLLAAAIERVKTDVGNWDEDEDEPTERLSQAALRMAELLALRPETAASAINDPTYYRLLKGYRRVFGIS
jgi:hypothetical protein